MEKQIGLCVADELSARTGRSRQTKLLAPRSPSCIEKCTKIFARRMPKSGHSTQAQTRVALYCSITA